MNTEADTVMWNQKGYMTILSFFLRKLNTKREGRSPGLIRFISPSRRTDSGISDMTCGRSYSCGNSSRLLRDSLLILMKETFGAAKILKNGC